MHQKEKITGEQEICLSCGICCDGTLFGKANLYQGEKGSLPEKIDANYFKTEKGEFFKLPCKYFSGKCTIYHEKKAMVCSGFRCKLLVNFSNSSISKQNAKKIISNVKMYKKELEDLAFAYHYSFRNMPFKILNEKIDILKSNTKYSIGNIKIEKLFAKSLILQILLTKHFLADEDFDKMVINPVSEEIEI